MSDVPGKDLRYNQLEYRAYSQRLRSKCSQHKQAAKVICGVFKDPITSFLRYNQAAAQLFAADNTPTEDDVLKDPTQCLMEFVALMLGKPSDDGAGFSEAVKQRLEDAITDWMVGESTIYSIAAESLRDHPKLISSNKNAGRHLLQLLDNYHNVNNKETTRVLLRAFNRFVFKKDDTLHSYKSRLDNLVKDLACAEPDNIVKTDSEKYIAYVDGLYKAGNFAKSLDTCEACDMELDATHEYLVRKENAAGEQISREYGISTSKTSW